MCFCKSEPPTQEARVANCCRDRDIFSGQPHQTLTHLHIVGTHYWNFCYKMASPGTRMPPSAGSLAQTEWICSVCGDVKRKAGVCSTLSAEAKRKPVA